jgi:hypothetical protein
VAAHVLLVSTPANLVAAPVPTVPVVQLWKRDVPELPYPANADVCRIRWCPLDHPPDYGPLVFGRLATSK